MANFECSIDLIEELENKNTDTEKIKQISETLEKQVTCSPENGNYWKSLGHTTLILGLDKRAHECYQNALVYCGTEDAELWYGIGLLYYRNNNFSYSEPSFLKVLSLLPHFSKRFSLFFKLGLIFKRFSHYKEAIEYFEKCMTTEDTSAALCQMGYCFNKLLNTEEAYNSYKSAFDLNKSPYTALCLGWHLMDQNLISSIEIFNEGLCLCKKDTIEELDLLYALARVYYKKKDYQEASNCYYKLLNKNSGDVNFLNSFGIMCAEIGQSAQAFRCFLKASEISQNSAEVWNNIGALYWKSGQVNESKLAYEKANKFSNSADVVKENSKEFSYTEWNISELPYIKRNAITKMKLDLREPEPVPKPITLPPPSTVPQGIINSYAAMIGYFNYARQINAMRQIRERNGNNNIDEDKQAAEILTDLAQILPTKRTREN